MDYEKFLQLKKNQDIESGIQDDMSILYPRLLFPFQKTIVTWALKRGRSAVFADTGLGKTAMQLTWANCVHQFTGNRVLILAPLCVAHQTVREGDKFGISVKYVRAFSDIASGDTGVFITNYEMLDHFESAIKDNYFDGIVLDESSIIKHRDGKTRTKIIDICKRIPHRLSCTATPSPNDHMELGNQAEFLGVMSMAEMLAMFFIHDSGETQKWRLKGHGAKRFWEWLSTWAVCIKKPSDIGFPDDGYNLPPVEYHNHIIESNIILEGELFPIQAQTLQERNRAKAQTIPLRVSKCAQIVNSNQDQWIVWCHRNEESKRLTRAIDGAVEVIGSDSIEVKEKRIMAFTNGDARVLVSKPSICGFGMNWQHCHNIAFVGLNDSYEQLYQAIRRCWRFGQTSPVNVHLISADIEGATIENIRRKEKQAEDLSVAIVGHMRDLTKRQITGLKTQKVDYMECETSGPGWELHLGDCVDFTKSVKENSIGYSVFSPPFSSLYTYSNSDRDMGNCGSDDVFYKHFAFLIKQLYRITMPGRHVSFHCMNLPTSKTNHGYIGIRDFRGDLIRAFVDCGFIYHSEVCIWKDPVTQMQRTKALGLLHKTIRKDSAMSRMGIADYVVTMRKPGDNPEPIPHTHEDFPVALWQKIASPIWMDINQSDTLNKKGARDNDDERHICPLQLGVIERCIMLWTKENDLVFSPFAGIGSEGYVAVKMKRRFCGVELKKSYYDLAAKHLTLAEQEQTTLF